MRTPLIISPKKTRWESFRDSCKAWSPQVKQAVIGGIILAFLTAIGWFVSSRNSSAKSSPTQSATTHGNNSPVTQNIGVSDATLQKVLSLKEVEVNKATQEKYPFGYVILERQKGRTTYDARLKGIEVGADWDNAKVEILPNNNAMILIRRIRIVAPNPAVNLEEFTLSDSWHYTIGEPRHADAVVNIYGINIYYEVLDAERGIFLVGFRHLRPEDMPTVPQLPPTAH